MRRTDPLNERQQAVLRWIGDGCPDGIMRDQGYKTSARALRDRGLVQIDRRGGGWLAELTEAGRYYLVHGKHPEVRNASASTSRPSAARADRPAPTQPSPPPVDHQEPEIEPAELVAQLERSNGRLTITDPSPATRAAWRRALDGVRRHGLLPEGQRLSHTGRNRGNLVIELRAHADPKDGRQRPRPAPFELSDEVDEQHPVAAQPFVEISEESQSRARQLAYALALAAERQDLAVAIADDGRGLTFRSGSEVVRIDVAEAYEARDILPDVDGADGERRYSWQRVRPVKQQVPTGRLVMTFEKDWHLPGRRARFADTQRWRLDDKLAEVLAEAVERLEARRTRREAAEQAERDRVRAWEAAMVKARHDFQESRRIAALDRQMDGWERANRIRAYCDALAAVHDEQDAERAAWVAWARGYADRLDPRGKRDVAPAIVEPQLHQLTEFLHGWSPYEAKRR